jgi:2-polyprenyl-3-methyl-5-hydroxy-6-metoxy-1,4-benzoquinol methylase/ribosomal protein S27E
MIDESRINPNLDKLYQHFDSAIAKYFKDDKPIPQYFEETGCYNCGKKEIVSSFVVNRFRHVRCKNCGMVYVSPRLKTTIINALYNEAPYTDFYRIKLIPSIDYRRNVLAVNKYNQINRHFNKPGKVLDIGSGVGEVLSVFKEKGWDCTGIEFNEFAADFARKTFGLNILNKNIYDIKLSEEFDVIMLWGVLEHLFEPVKILKKANKLLKKDGLLLLEVPSSDSVLVQYYERTQKRVDRIIEGDRHIMLFSLRSFKEMTQKAGFKPIEILSNGLDISTLNRLELRNRLSLDQVNELQGLVDASMQGDLLRGFFKKG